MKAVISEHCALDRFLDVSKYTSPSPWFGCYWCTNCVHEYKFETVDRGTFIPCPKPLMNYTRNIGDVELTRGWLCGKCLEHMLCLILSLSLYSVTKLHFCMHMAWGLATALQSKLAKQLHGTSCCTRWKTGRKVCSVVYSERCWQPTIISVGILKKSKVLIAWIRNDRHFVILVLTNIKHGILFT
jgi:hypothetical protein